MVQDKTHVNVVQNKVHAISRPSVRHGVLGLVVQLHNATLVEHDFSHVLLVRANEKVHLDCWGWGRGTGSGDARQERGRETGEG